MITNRITHWHCSAVTMMILLILLIHEPSGNSRRLVTAVHMYTATVYMCGLIVHYTQRERETVVKALIINGNVKPI